jgi:sulfoxide reductase heme-binding subunit YedZ
MTDMPLTWFVMRSSGLVAVALLTVAVVLGLIGPRLRPTPRLSAITVHRASSSVGTILIVAHIVLAVLDKWIVLDWPAALVPGVAQWERWGVALGALAVDLLIALLITTAVRMRGPRLWRRVHLLAYPIWALSVGHGLLVGSDAAVMRALALGCAGIVALALSVRLLVRPRSVPTAPTAPTSHPAPTSPSGPTTPQALAKELAR